MLFLFVAVTIFVIALRRRVEGDRRRKSGQRSRHIPQIGHIGYVGHGAVVIAVAVAVQIGHVEVGHVDARLGRRGGGVVGAALEHSLEHIEVGNHVHLGVHGSHWHHAHRGIHVSLNRFVDPSLLRKQFFELVD